MSTRMQVAMSILIVAAAIYFVMSWGAAKLQHRLENHFARERRQSI